MLAMYYVANGHQIICSEMRPTIRIFGQPLKYAHFIKNVFATAMQKGRSDTILVFVSCDEISYRAI